jgi:hypothetical protein
MQRLQALSPPPAGLSRYATALHSCLSPSLVNRQRTGTCCDTGWRALPEWVSAWVGQKRDGAAVSRRHELRRPGHSRGCLCRVASAALLRVSGCLGETPGAALHATRWFGIQRRRHEAETWTHPMRWTADRPQLISLASPVPAGGDAQTTSSLMLSLVSLVQQKNWEQCHEMLDGRNCDVHQRDTVRPALTTRTRRIVAPTPPNLGPPFKPPPPLRDLPTLNLPYGPAARGSGLRRPRARASPGRPRPAPQ